MTTLFLRAARSALLGILALHGAACDVHIDCAETQTCARPREWDAGATDAGDTPDAAEPEPLTCEPGTGDCDGARFNGCEVDLTSDVSHCGGCGSVCDGACRDARCVALEVIATNQRHFAAWGGIGFDASRVYWGSSADADPDIMTWRIQSWPKAGGAVTQGPPSHAVDQLFVGNGVLFTRSRRSPAIFMLALNGTNAQPIISSAAAYDYYAGELVWAEQLENLVGIHKLDEATLMKTPLVPVAGVSGLASSLSVHRGTIAYANAQHIGRFRADVGAHSIVQHAGDFGRLRLERSQSGSLIVWNDAGGLAAVDPYAAAPTRSSLVGGVTVLDFAITPRGDIYYAWEQSAHAERGISLLKKNSATPSLIVSACGRSLELDGDYLYFFDCEKRRLVRLALEAR